LLSCLVGTTTDPLQARRGVRATTPRAASPPPLRHPHGKATDEDADQQHANQVSIERQHHEQHWLIGPEGIKHKPHTMPIDDGKREQHDHRRHGQQVF